MYPGELETKLKVNYMKQRFFSLVPILALIAPLAAFAEVPALPDAETTSYQGRPATGEDAATHEAMRGHGAKPRGHCGHGKGKGGKAHGGHDKGKGGRAHGGGRHGKHDEVVRRLDMIEARIAKIELMLESLMKRR